MLRLPGEQERWQDPCSSAALRHSTARSLWPTCGLAAWLIFWPFNFQVNHDNGDVVLAAAVDGSLGQNAGRDTHRGLAAGALFNRARQAARREVGCFLRMPQKMQDRVSYCLFSLTGNFT